MTLAYNDAINDVVALLDRDIARAKDEHGKLIQIPPSKRSLWDNCEIEDLHHRLISYGFLRVIVDNMRKGQTSFLPDDPMSFKQEKPE